MDESAIRELITSIIDPFVKRVEKLESTSEGSGKWQAKYGEKIDNMEKSINTMLISIGALSAKPEKRWEQVVSLLFTLGIGAIMFLAGQYFTK